MFDIGFSEIVLIAVVALLVLGPERLPKAARFTGMWVKRARNQWDSVKTEFEREMAAEDLKRSLDDARRQASEIADQMGDVQQQLRDQPTATATAATMTATATTPEPAAAGPVQGEQADQPALSDPASPQPAYGHSVSLEGPLPSAPPQAVPTSQQESPRG